ncbi:MAG TPA: AraC family transcriptional regulator [Puia sp.]
MRLNGMILLSRRDLKGTEQAITYIEKHYADRISPERLSVEVGLSVQKLQAGLKLKTGYSLYGYQEQVRIRFAKLYLEETDKPLRTVATSMGFKTLSHFGEIFKKHTRMTPSQYRNEYGIM